MENIFIFTSAQLFSLFFISFYGSKYLSVSDSLYLKTLMVLVVQVCWWQFYKLSLFEKVFIFLSCVLSVYECLWDFSVLLILSNLIAMRLVFIMFQSCSLPSVAAQLHCCFHGNSPFWSLWWLLINYLGCFCFSFWAVFSCQAVDLFCRCSQIPGHKITHISLFMHSVPCCRWTLSRLCWLHLDSFFFLSISISGCRTIHSFSKNKLDFFVVVLGVRKEKFLCNSQCHGWLLASHSP